MSVYVITLPSMLVVDTQANIYNAIMDREPTKLTRKHRAIKIIIYLGLIIWGLMLLIN